VAGSKGAGEQSVPIGAENQHDSKSSHSGGEMSAATVNRRVASSNLARGANNHLHANASIHAPTNSIANVESAIRPAAHSDEGHLLQVREMPFLVLFSFCGLDLLNRRLCREGSIEVFPVHLSKRRQFR
jgi:hypothetical protein